MRLINPILLGFSLSGAVLAGYLESCNGRYGFPNVEGSTLGGWCYNAAGSYVWTTLNLDVCIANANGDLVVRLTHNLTPINMYLRLT